jgi:hypothetical protein
MSLSWLEQRKQQAAEYQYRMEMERRRQQQEKEAIAAAAARQSQAILDQERKVNDDINFLMNSPIPHFDDQSPPTIQELFDSPYQLVIGRKRVVEGGELVWIPTLVAKDGDQVVCELNLCSRVTGTGQEKGFGELRIPDMKPYQQMIDHHNQHIRRNEK